MSDLSLRQKLESDDLRAKTVGARDTVGAENRRTADLSPSQRVGADIDRLAREAQTRTTGASRDLDRRRDNLQDFPKENSAWRTVDQATRDDIRQRIDAFVDQQREMLSPRVEAAEKIQDRLSRASDELARAQQAERDRLTAPDATLQQRHDAQQRELAQLADETVKSFTRALSLDDQRARDQRELIADALVSAQPREIQQVLNEATEQNNDLAKRFATDMSVLDGHVKRMADEIVQAQSALASSQLREKLGAMAKNLDDGAIARIALADNARNSEQATNAIKGQLFEELLSTQLVEEMKLAAQADLRDRGISATVQFVSGDRIRDDQNRKLTDGMLLWQDEASKQWHIVKAFEAKAGELSAGKLTELLDRMTEKLRRETERYAQDVVREELAGRNVSDAAKQQRYEQVLADLYSDKTQIEHGQLTRTQERMTTDTDYDTRIYIDGRAELLARDQRRATVEGVAPNDVAAKVDRRLDVTMAELDEAAARVAAFLEEERDRKRREAESN